MAKRRAPPFTIIDEQIVRELGDRSPQCVRAWVAVPHLLRDREAFLRAVLTHTTAIHELHCQRATLAITPSIADHMAPRPADPNREAIVRAWAEQRHLAAAWVEAWGVAALRRWEVGAACRDPHCPFACTAIAWDDVVSAFEVALFRLAEEWFAGESLGLDLLRGVEELLPNPFMFETLDEWIACTTDAYLAAKRALTAQGIAVARPRELARHCAWLVRVQILREPVAEIAVVDHVDDSSIHRAIKDLAQRIDLPLRG